MFHIYYFTNNYSILEDIKVQIELKSIQMTYRASIDRFSSNYHTSNNDSNNNEESNTSDREEEEEELENNNKNKNNDNKIVIF